MPGQPKRKSRIDRLEFALIGQKEGSPRKRYGRVLGDIYRKKIRGHIKNKLHQQRFKFIYDIWWYYPLLTTTRLSLGQRLSLIYKLLRIDWFVLHGNKPCELTPLLVDLMRRRAREHEILVEAGCWNGGSSSKFSIVCNMFGYKLHIYDSFQGVKEWGFAYAASETDVRNNIEKYGELSVCTFHPGWFKDTLLDQPVAFPVRMAYIDCDVPNGTKEVLSGVLPRLAEDGVIYTQDYHLSDVRAVIDNTDTWHDLGTQAPKIEHLIRNIARITWDGERTLVRG